MILGVIEKARIGAAEQSALGYIDAVEKQVAINQVKNENLINDGTYEVPVTDIKVKGEVPTKGWLTIEKGMVTNYSFVIGKYVVTKGEKTIKGDEPIANTDVSKKYTVYNNGTAIYYNPETNSKCNENEAVSTTGTKTGCMKWYTFNDEGEETEIVNMILDHNTTAGVTWSSSKTQVTTDTKTWDSSLNARLITADEVAQITGNTSFDSKTSSASSWFYLDSNSQTQTAKSQGASIYAWLFDYTYDCTNYGCNIADSSTYGYWTSNIVYNNSSNAWDVFIYGRLYNDYVSYTNRGVRPVITVLKSKIS